MGLPVKKCYIAAFLLFANLHELFLNIPLHKILHRRIKLKLGLWFSENRIYQWDFFPGCWMMPSEIFFFFPPLSGLCVELGSGVTPTGEGLKSWINQDKSK